MCRELAALLYQPLSPIINMQQHDHQNGYTLIEILLVIILLGILVAGSANLLHTGFNSFFTGKNIINANWQGHIALERMTHDIRAIRSPSDIIGATANAISAKDLYGNTITYQMIGSQLQRNTQFIADGVQSIIFNYYQSNGTILNPPLSSASLMNIRYIVITLNMNYNNITFPITATIYLWNLK